MVEHAYNSVRKSFEWERTAFFMKGSKWILCPICGGKTRTKIRKDTESKNFPLFCPKCRKETLINLIQGNITIIKEPDAKTQSR